MYYITSFLCVPPLRESAHSDVFAVVTVLCDSSISSPCGTCSTRGDPSSTFSLAARSTRSAAAAVLGTQAKGP